MKRGAFIVFEGIDRSGKSTQSLLLHQALEQEKKQTIHLRFPDNTTQIGSMLRSYLENKSQLEDHSVHLMFAANRWECKQKILNLLSEGKNVIVDRYAYSGVAYTAAKGYDLDWCKGPDRGLPVPDMVIYLQLSVQEAAKRGEYGQERYENEPFQAKVSQIYEQLKDDTWRIVDATKSKEEIQSYIRALADEAIQKTDQPVQLSLWLQ